MRMCNAAPSAVLRAVSAAIGRARLRAAATCARALRSGAMAMALTGVVLATGTAGARGAEAPRRAVQDPYYGVALYDFYQENYFSSLTGLMVAQQLGRVGHHVEDAEILRGGLYLSYGLHREAAEIFARLIERGAPAAVRDRAWYYLAKIRYQRGLLADAEDAIGRVKGLLPGALQEDKVLLHANLLMGHGDYTGAAQVLRTLGDGARTGAGLVPDAGLYARYNLGVALIKSGAVARGSEMLDEIGVVPATTEEFRSLRDKANVALGFAAMQGQDPERARVYLERVRLTGMLANKALLGFGWAADALHRPKDALVPWMELAARDTSDAAVLEAKLAVPYALAEIGVFGRSLDYYGGAIAAFEHESVRLDESIAAIRAGALLDGLLARNPGVEMGWFWNIDRLPRMPHAGHLVEVIAQHEFQEAFKNYRDLQFLADNLREWEGKLGVLDDMLSNRRQAFAERLPEVRLRARAAGLDDLEHRRDALRAELRTVEARDDGALLADARERALLERLARVRATLDAHAGERARDRDIEAARDRDIEAARDRYRRVAGALQWELTLGLPPRLWDASKGLHNIEEEVAQARLADAALAHAQATEPLHFDEYGARIGRLRQRVQELIPRVRDLAAEQRQAVQEMAVAELVEQKERLAVYTNQARFAVAQIYDRASAAQEAAHAAATAPAPKTPTPAQDGPTVPPPATPDAH